MIGGKNIAKTLIILLLILVSNDQAYQSTASRQLFHDGITANNRRVTVSKYPLSVTVHAVKKYKIRVRYMGGECSYNGTAVPTLLSLPGYINQTEVSNYSSFVYSSHHFIFKLRGPPVC